MLKRTFAFWSVNPFPEFFRKKFWKERSFLFRLRYRIRVLRERFIEGTAEHGSCIFLIKTFLDKKTNVLFFRYD